MHLEIMVRPPLQSKLIKPFFLSIIFLLALFTNLWANEYYVAKNGNDKNSGTEAQPWLTIQKAANTAVAGDTVFIKSGTYSEIVNFPNSGTSGKYITFQNYGTDSVTVDGTGHTSYIGVLSINSKSYIKIIGLNITNSSTTTGTKWGVQIDGTASGVASYIELTNLNISNTGDDGIELMNEGNEVHHVTITGCVVHDGDASGIMTYLKSGSARVHDCTIIGCTVYSFANYGIGSEQADNLIIDGNTIYDCNMGLDIGSGASNIIKNNLIYNCSSNGIGISSNSNSLIYNNTIHDVTDEAFYSYYWSGHGEPQINNHYYNNIVYNAGSGLWESNKKPTGSEGASSNHRYYNNLFYNISSEHGAAFYFIGVTGVEFYNNTIYLNGGNNGLEFVTSALGQGSTNHVVENNIISISGPYSSILEDTGSLPNSIVDYNCYQNRSGTHSGPGNHSILGDPKFINVSGANFNLASNSPCIDSGDSGGDIPATDVKGNSRCDDPSVPNVGGGFIPYFDIGAYEYPCVDITPPAPPTRLRILN